GTAPVEIRVISPGSGPGSAVPPSMPASPPPPVLPTAAVMPPPAAPPVTVVNAPAASIPGAKPMFIQAGVFADHENARRRVEMLLAAGVPFASVEEFDLNLERLHTLGIGDARLLTD